MKNALGLVMTGGGARGAFQAGVLKRIAEIKRAQNGRSPFSILGGASAGAINATALAAGSDDFPGVTGLMAGLWCALKPSDIFRCGAFAQTRNALTWIMDLSFGGVLNGGRAQSLLDSAPLRSFLQKHLDCERIQENIRRGYLYALAVSATNYQSGRGYVFVQGKRGHPMWSRSRHVTLATKITVDHVWASASIPLVFRPVKLPIRKETAYFGDGCVRLQQPLSPVIRLGAEKILAIGVRGESQEHQQETANGEDPSISEVLGVLLNAIFLDHLVADVEHVERLNHLISKHKGVETSADEGDSDGMHPVSTLLIAPSLNLSELAERHCREMPYLIQYFVNGLGREAASCADLMSYLLFASKYTSELVQLGYDDAGRRIDEIEDFLYAGS